jgi:hypothetical protein
VILIPKIANQSSPRVARLSQPHKPGAAEHCSNALLTWINPLLGATDKIHQSVGRPIRAFDTVFYHQLLADVRAALGETSFLQMFERGRTLSLDQAMAAVQTETSVLPSE